jgi:threonylcarbamoyladenosine tRNA methylthiotransferase MtaB
MRFSINTLGCKVNLCESDEMSAIFTRRGLLKVDFRDGDPQLCIINTCTVTSESDRKARQLIRKIRKTNRDARLAVIGCYVRDHRDFLEENGVDIILDNDGKKDMQDLVESILKKADYKPEAKKVSHSPCHYPYSDHSRPIVKIQDGCEQGCAYCIVPRVRGSYRSVEGGKVLREIEKLVKSGYEEVVLTGIHIGKYGIDIDGDTGLSGLVEGILSGTGIKRIRMSSLEINEIDEELVKVIVKNDKRIAPHLHIPLQSGSDRILKKMGRLYNIKYFTGRMEMLRRYLPGTAFTTDVMAGFPGETEADFKNTYEMVKKLRFSKLHIFRYSPRPGTAAFSFKDRVSGQDKQERSRILRALGDRMRNSFIKENIGKELLTAVERNAGSDGLLSGTSGNYIKIYFRTDADYNEIHGKLVKIKVQKVYRNGLSGIIAS